MQRLYVAKKKALFDIHADQHFVATTVVKPAQMKSSVGHGISRRCNTTNTLPGDVKKGMRPH